MASWKAIPKSDQYLTLGRRKICFRAHFLTKNDLKIGFKIGPRMVRAASWKAVPKSNDYLALGRRKQIDFGMIFGLLLLAFSVFFFLFFYLFENNSGFDLKAILVHFR